MQLVEVAGHKQRDKKCSLFNRSISSLNRRRVASKRWTPGIFFENFPMFSDIMSDTGLRSHQNTVFQEWFYCMARIAKDCNRVVQRRKISSNGQWKQETHLPQDSMWGIGRKSHINGCLFAWQQIKSCCWIWWQIKFTFQKIVASRQKNLWQSKRKELSLACGNSNLVIDWRIKALDSPHKCSSSPCNTSSKYAEHGCGEKSEKKHFTFVLAWKLSLVLLKPFLLATTLAAHDQTGFEMPYPRILWACLNLFCFQPSETSTSPFGSRCGIDMSSTGDLLLWRASAVMMAQLVRVWVFAATLLNVVLNILK